LIFWRGALLSAGRPRTGILGSSDTEDFSAMASND